MSQLWIAKKNPPFKRNGIDKPFFFNSYWKRKGSLTDDQIIAKSLNIFDGEYFDSNIEGEITSSLSFQTFIIRLPQTDEIFKSSFFKVKLDKENFNRYCWVINTNYRGQNTIEFTLETDLWITFIHLIKFSNSRSVETKRRMNNRFGSNTDKINVLRDGNQFWDDLGKRSYEFEYKIPLKPLPTTDFSNRFKFFGGSEAFVYGMLTPTENLDAFNSGAISPYLNKEDKLIPPAGLLIPILPDDEVLPPDPTGKDPEVWKDNKYHSVATQVSNTVLNGLFLLPIMPPSTNEINVDDTTQFPLALAKLSDTFGVIVISKFEIGDWLNDSSPVYDYTTYLTNEKPFLFVKGKLLDTLIFKNEPCYWNHQTAAIQINNANNDGAEIPFEFFFQDNEITNLFKSKIIFSGTILSVIHKVNFDTNIFGKLIKNNQLFASIYDTSFQADMTLPSATTGWVNYMQNNRNSFYNSQAQGKFNGYFGIGGGVFSIMSGVGTMAAGAAATATGVGAVAAPGLMQQGANSIVGGANSIGNSIFNLKALQAQVSDMKNQAGSSNNASLDASGMIAKGTIIKENQVSQEYNYRESIIGTPYIKRVGTGILNNIIKHYRLFGNPIQERLKITFETLQNREFWNFWQIEDIQNTFIFDNIPPFVIDYLDSIFTDGIRLWTIWWDENDNFIDTIYNHDLENWETSLGLEFAQKEV